MTLINSGSNTPLYFWIVVGAVNLAALLWTASRKLFALFHGCCQLIVCEDCIYVDDLECGIYDMGDAEEEEPFDL